MIQDGFRFWQRNEFGKWYTIGVLFDMEDETYLLSLTPEETGIIDWDPSPYPFHQLGVVSKLSVILTLTAGEAYFDAVRVSTTPTPSIPGDTDGDGDVDEADAATVADNWGNAVPQGDVSYGDFNNDGVVDAADASILAANWGDHNPPPGATAPVPEPSTMVLLLGLPVVALLRRQK